MNDASSGGVLGTLRGLLVTGIALSRVRLALFATEVREERARVAGLLMYGFAAVLLLWAGVVFLAAFFTVLFWESHRLLVLGACAAVFIAAGLWAVMTARHHAGTPSRLFAASLDELARDQARAEAGDQSQPS